tara:strand:+ start:1125 stop:1454 length:330 start_codon:yes stop_codon:yes gene_type:complete
MEDITKELNSATDYLRAMKKSGHHKGDCDNILMHLANIEDLANKLFIANVTPRFSVSLVYQNQTANMLRTLVTDANSKDEALGKAIQYFNKETDGFGLILKSVTHLNEG